MRKKRIPNIVIHVAENKKSNNVTNNINDLYVEIIRRKILNDNYTFAQRIKIIDGIIKNLKTCETTMQSN